MEIDQKLKIQNTVRLSGGSISHEKVCAAFVRMKAEVSCQAAAAIDPDQELKDFISLVACKTSLWNSIFDNQSSPERNPFLE